MSDATGIERTATGEIAEPGSQQTTDQTTEQTQQTTDTTAKAAETTDDKSLLNQKDDKDAAPEGAPEKYEAFNLPEGVELSEESMTEANTLFKAMNLSQAQAQQLVDFHVKSMQAAADAPMQLWADTQKEWVNQVKADKDIGHRLPAVKAAVSKVVDSLGPLAVPFREAMDLTGAGNHPAFIKAMFAIATKLTEGGHVTAGGPSALGQKPPGARPASAASAMYPNLPSAG